MISQAVPRGPPDALSGDQPKGRKDAMTTETTTAPVKAPKAARAPKPPIEDLDLDETREDPEARAHAEHAARVPIADDDADIPLDDLTLVDDKDIEMSMPLIERARVIYTGNNPKRSQALRGWMVTESWEVEPAEPEVKDAQGRVVTPGRPAQVESSKTPTMETNITSYDFSKLDSRNKILTSRLMPRTAHPRVAGKVWHLCEHPEHLRLFKRWKGPDGQPEFEVLIPRHLRPVWDNYVADKERQIGRHNTLADYAQGLRETPE